MIRRNQKKGEVKQKQEKEKEKKRKKHTNLHLHMRRVLQRPVPLVLRRRVKDVEVHPTARADFQDARSVPAPVAVVRGRPNGREAVVEKDAKPLHAQLVRTQDVRHVVDVEEPPDDAGAKGVACTAVRVVRSSSS